MSAQVVVQLSPGLGGEIAAGPFMQILQQHGGVLVPGSVVDLGEGGMSAIIELSAPEHAAQLAEAIARIEGVEAAYVKPATELP